MEGALEAGIPHLYSLSTVCPQAGDSSLPSIFFIQIEATTTLEPFLQDQFPMILCGLIFLNITLSVWNSLRDSSFL